jgi:hypothetical protein
MKKRFLQITLIVCCLAAQTILAQPTAFNYQGKLTEGGSAANGSYQMQFKLFDSLSGGSQIGATISDVNLTVTNGIFSTKLDFGANALSGANRFLEIAVRHSSSEFYTLLAPREQIASSPYAVRTLSAQQADNALNLGGIPASEYVTTSSVGSSFIRNSLSQQFANFNITGNGFFGGSVGIGTTNPIQLLHVKSQAGLNAASLIEAPAGFFAQYQLESGVDDPWVIGTQDNFANGALLFRKTGNDFMAIRQTGNVGIGTTSPIAKLTIVGGGLNGQSLNVSNDAGFGGNTTQARDKGGMVKAMIDINGDGAINRCYNATTNSSSGNCGFTVLHLGSGRFSVIFGFRVDDRFISVSVRNSQNGDGSVPAAVVYYEFVVGFNDRVFAYTHQIGSNTSDRPFTIFVY